MRCLLFTIVCTPLNPSYHDVLMKNNEADKEQDQSDNDLVKSQNN